MRRAAPGFQSLLPRHFGIRLDIEKATVNQYERGSGRENVLRNTMPRFRPRVSREDRAVIFNASRNANKSALTVAKSYPSSGLNDSPCPR